MGYVLPSGLFIPKSHPDLPDRRCTVPGCDARFPYEQKGAWRRHVVKCADDNPKLQAEYEDRESDPLRSVSDKEQYAHLRRRAAERKENVR